MAYKEHKPFYRYSDEQKQTVHNVDMVSFLEHYEGLTFKRAGSGYRCNEHDSLFINADRRRWYWNSHGTKGSDVIHYLKDEKGLSFPESMKLVLDDYLRLPNIEQTLAPPVSESKREEKQLKLPKATEGKYSRAFAYLTYTRGIDREIVQEMMHQKSIYQDERGNVIFVGRDEAQTPRFGCIRGTLTQKSYRGDCSGSDKRFAFRIAGAKESESVYIFEAPIDALSHATMVKQAGGNWRKCHRITLAGTSDVALAQFLKTNPHTKTLVFCLDNDKAGRENTALYQKKYEAKGYRVMDKPPQYNDYNEDLTNGVKLQSPKRQLQRGGEHLQSLTLQQSASRSR